MNVAIGLFIIISTGFLLVIGKSLFVPLIIAIFVWFLIKILAESAQRKIKSIPSVMAYILSTLFLVFLVVFPIQLVSSSVPDILVTLPKYEANIYQLLEKILTQFSIEKTSAVQSIKDNISISEILSSIANSLTGFTSNLLLVLMYVAFLFAEQGTIKDKVLLLAKDKTQKKKFENIITRVDDRVTLYLGIKTQLSFFTALLSYFVMIAIGIDFAAFWAMLIFILNFIPSIGSLIGTILPVSLALIQFTTATPAILALAGIGIVQFVIGNIIEPKKMGKSLNLSPLVILLSLFLWGSIWGTTGLFMSIPITVILMIVFAEFKNTRSIAILLSSNGKLDT
jgi:AI-2 transport protein TqsA